MNPRIKTYLTRAAVATGLVALLGSAGTAAFLWNSLGQVSKEVSARDEQLKALQTKLDAEGKALNLAKEQLKKSGGDSAELERTRASVEAFAKQAATCVAVKRKLHIES